MRVLISGVGTEVGKTWVAEATARCLRNHGLRCGAIKPVESGGNNDGRLLQRATGFHVEPSPYTFLEAIGPHLAARRAGVTIDLLTCCQWVDRVSSGFEVTVIELAGGLLSPLSDTLCNADLLPLLGVDAWVAVALDRLGVLHDVRALLLSTQHLGIQAPFVVLNAPRLSDRSTGTNATELERVGTCQVAAQFPRGAMHDPATRQAANSLVAALGLG